MGFPLKYLSEDVIPYLCKSFSIYYLGHFVTPFGTIKKAWQFLDMLANVQTLPPYLSRN